MSHPFYNPSNRAASTADPALRMTSLGSATPSVPPVVSCEPRAQGTQHHSPVTERLASGRRPLPLQVTYSAFASHQRLPHGGHGDDQPSQARDARIGNARRSYSAREAAS